MSDARRGHEWGIWCLTTKTWVFSSTRESGYTPVDCRYPSRRAANADLKAWCIKGMLDRYEVRRYKEEK